MKRSIEVCEARADNAITDSELGSVRYPNILTRSGGHTANSLMLAVQSVAIPKVNAGYVAWQVRCAVEQVDSVVLQRSDSYPAQADLVREILGNPFRPVAFDPKWRTEHTVGLALRMYDDHDFAAMPILADALEEAGCGNPDILAHCREPGVHVRGCWVADLVLGKA